MHAEKLTANEIVTALPESCYDPDRRSCFILQATVPPSRQT